MPSLLLAQQLPAPTASPADSDSAGQKAAVPVGASASSTVDTVVQLSPFTVSAVEDEGYRAQNTLAGSRLNSSLRDTPGVLDVMTPEFLADIGATDITQALGFSTNFAEDTGDFDSQNVTNTIFPGSQQTVTFRTRGLNGTIARNYLETGFRPSFYTVERIDNSSGPNSILFGLGSAGGVANITTKVAKLNRNDYEAGFLFDENGSKRGTIDVNQALVRQKFGLRVNAMSNRGKRYRSHFTDNSDGLHLASTLRIGERTEVRAEFEVEHVSGTVAYPSPHIENVTNWVNAGQRIVTLPTNWETLSTTARNAFAAANITPYGMAVTGTTVRPVVVQMGDQNYVLNSAINVTTTGSNGQTIAPSLFNDRGNIQGPGGTKGVDRKLVAVAVDHKLAEKLYLNFAASRERGSAETYQAYANGAAGGATILADPNATIPFGSQIVNMGSTTFTSNASGQIANPFAGQYFAESRWLHRTQKSDREIVQATAAWQADFGRWFGSHRFVASTSYSDRSSGSENYRESWLNAPFNSNPLATQNGLVRRRYAHPLDANNYHVPDWRPLEQVTWNHPTLGRLQSGWVSEGENYQEANQFTYLFAGQSRFFKRRLVLTTGYRVDRQNDYVYGDMTIKPPGWENSTGLNVLNPNDVVKSTTKGATRTLGGVVHVTDWLSVYANKSTNFGPPRGTTVGPDAVIGPNTQGEGLDTGVKFDLLHGKLNIDVGYFDTASNDVTEVLNLNLRSPDSIPGAYNGVMAILTNPVGAAPLLNANDPAAVEALKASYSLLRPTFNATGDLLDQASRGYEVRLTANLAPGFRVRATFSQTEREREELYKYTRPMGAQLRAYVGDLQKRNPSVNVGALTTAADTTASVDSLLAAFDERIEDAIDRNGNNFGGGRHSFNFVATYDFQKFLKGLGVSLSTNYKSGAYTGVYEVREGGTTTGELLESVPVFGNSTIDYGAMVRYRLRAKWLGSGIL